MNLIYTFVLRLSTFSTVCSQKNIKSIVLTLTGKYNEKNPEKPLKVAPGFFLPFSLFV